jgi:signal transduction histidine kinase
MISSNWIYLALGLSLGMGFRSLFARSKVSSNSSPASVVDKHSISALEQQIKQTQLAYDMAQEIGQFKAGFLARTTHELRSPISQLISLHQLILSDLCENPAEEREFIAQAHNSADKLMKLIDEILKIARIEHGTNKLDIQPLQLAQQLQEIYQLTHLLAANRNYPFEIVPLDPEIYVLADQRWLRYVLLNLVDTSLLAMESGSIRISASPKPINNIVHIWLDVPTHAVTSNELIDLIESKDKQSQINPKNTSLSPGMKLLLNQTLLEVMDGKLEIVPYPTTKDSSEQQTRLQLSIPSVILEAELLSSGKESSWG